MLSYCSRITITFVFFFNSTFVLAGGGGADAGQAANRTSTNGSRTSGGLSYGSSVGSAPSTGVGSISSGGFSTGTNSSTGNTTTSGTRSTGSSIGSGTGSNSGGDNDDVGVGNTFSNQYGSVTSGYSTGTSLSYGANLNTSISTGVNSQNSSVSYSMGAAVSVNSPSNSGNSGNSGGSGNSGLSMGTPANNGGSAVVNSMLMGLSTLLSNSPVAQTFANGLQRVASTTQSTVARVAQQATRVISTHFSASVAGAQNMANSIRGTVGAGGLGYQEAVEAAYYRGVADYYNRLGVPASARIIPTGPMARVYGMATVVENPVMTAIDQAFNRGSVSVVSRRLGTSDQHMREFLGPQLYDNLTDMQRLAVEGSVLVGGTASTGTGAQFQSDIIRANTNGYASVNTASLYGETYYSTPGFVVVDVNQTTNYQSTLHHELQHAGEQVAFESAVRRAYGQEEIMQDEWDRLQEVISRLEPVIADGIYEAIASLPTPHVMRAGLGQQGYDQLMRSRDYYTSQSEVRAFAVDTTNREMWASQFSQSAGVSRQDALDLFDSVIAEEGVFDPNSPENSYADDLLRGGL